MAIHQPHDHLFKRVFGVPAEAASFLKAWLPAPLRRSLRWSTLKRHSASFVDSTLRGAASDLLFEIVHAEPSADQAQLWLGQDDMRMFVRYILETGPDDTPEALGEILSRTAAGGEMRTSGERLRQEGRDQMRAVAEQRHREGQREGRMEGQREGRMEGQREGRLETIDGFLRTGVDWSVIERATGIDQAEYRKLKSEQGNGGSADRDGQGRD